MKSGLDHSIYFLLILIAIWVPPHLGQAQGLYHADFSNEGDGFPDHDMDTPPITAPPTQSESGGLAPNDWMVSYQADPSTDGTTNEFSVDEKGNMRIQDWGDQPATWISAVIDVSDFSLLNIHALGTTIGTNVQNTASEFFEYFYVLDGGVAVITDVSIGNEGPGAPVNYSIMGLDVSGVSSLQVGFRFQVNGAGDGYLISSFEVSSPLLPIVISSFEVINQAATIKIHFETTSEIQSDLFGIEKHLDGNWVSVERMLTSNSSFGGVYNYVDRKPIIGLNQYRIRHTDSSGFISYSEIKSAHFSQREFIYPTKTADYLILDAMTNLKSATISISNGYGVEVERKRVIFDGPNAYYHYVGHLPTGTYLFILHRPQRPHFVSRFVKI